MLTSAATHECQHARPGAAASRGAAPPALRWARPARRKKVEGGYLGQPGQNRLGCHRGEEAGLQLPKMKGCQSVTTAGQSWYKLDTPPHPPSHCCAACLHENEGPAAPSTSKMPQNGSSGGAEAERPVQTDGTYLLFVVAACAGPDAPQDQGHQAAPARQHSLGDRQQHGGEPERQSCVLRSRGSELPQGSWFTAPRLPMRG